MKPELSLQSIVLAIVMAMAAVTGQAQETLRPVTASYSLEAGSAHRADTYLSPLKYSGWAAAFSYERMQAMKFDPDRWVMRLAVTVGVDRSENPAGNAALWYTGADISWGMNRRWRLLPRMSAGIGGSTMLSLGCLYMARNSNNPASARASWTVDVTGYVNYDVRLRNLPVTLRYRATIPVTGAFFSPDYGELYYEIYLGNRSKLAHCAWWGNYFALENLLTADLHLGNTSLRVGYRGDILTTRVNNVTTRAFVHCAVLGVTGEWISWRSGRTLSPEARTISANY